MTAAMVTWTATALEHGQGWKQVGELTLAFALSSVVGLERHLRGKSAGLRTQAIVGTAAALFLLVSKYGFTDVLVAGHSVLDPSRVAAQVVSGIGFLGAGLIITRRGAIRGLTTAASVWETAAIGMAAGAGLPLLALAAAGLHFVIVLGFTPLGRLLDSRTNAERDLTITYEDGRGVLRKLIAMCGRLGWRVNSLRILGSREDERGPSSTALVTVTLSIVGQGTATAIGALGGVAGVVHIEPGEDDEDD